MIAATLIFPGCGNKTEVSAETLGMWKKHIRKYLKDWVFHKWKTQNRGWLFILY